MEILQDNLTTPQGFRDNNVIVNDINQDWAWFSERTLFWFLY